MLTLRFKNILTRIRRTLPFASQNVNFVALLIVIFLFLYPIPCTLYPAHAADSTPSADIKLKLEELKKEIASKAAKLKDEVNNKLKDKAYIGAVKSKSDTSFTLAAQSGPKIININQDTIFESKIKSKQKNLQKNINLEDNIAALGDSDETGVLTARKIILLSTAQKKPKTYLWGKIVSISDQLTTLKSNELKNVAASLPSEPQIKLGDFVILTGNKDRNEVFDAGFVYIIPQGSSLRTKKIATPSAQAATKSAKPKTATKSATPKPASR